MCRCHSPFVDTVFRAVSRSVGSQSCSTSVSFFSNEGAKGLVGNTQISFVEYVAHPADFVFKLPEKTSYEEATLFEPLAVGLYSVVSAKVSFGGEILILGAGPIGLATLQGAEGKNIVFKAKLIIRKSENIFPRHGGYSFVLANCS